FSVAPKFAHLSVEDLAEGMPDRRAPKAKLTAQELLNANGIYLKNYNPGNHTSICPKCSHDRKKKKTRCLSVLIDTHGACWNCHHCGGSGPEKGQRTNNIAARPVTEISVTKPSPEPKPSSKPASAGKTHYVYHTANGIPAFRKIRAYDKDGEN